MRPSKEDVDEALGHAETLREMFADGSRMESFATPSEGNLLVLAAEVQALHDGFAQAEEKFAKMAVYAQQLESVERTVRGILEHARDEVTAGRHENAFQSIEAALRRLPKE